MASVRTVKMPSLGRDLDKRFSSTVDCERTVSPACTSRCSSTSCQPRLATTRPKVRVVSAVATLIIDREYDERGTIGDDGALTLDPDGPVLAEELARRVVANGGRVLALSADRLPGGSPITAVLRYAQ